MANREEKIPSKIPYVGIGTIIARSGKLLLMKRRLSNGRGSWSSPGGYLSFGETPADCAAREAAEEVGFQGGSFSFLAITNDVFAERHFLTVWMTSPAPPLWDVTKVSEEVAQTGWFFPSELPEPLFEPFANLIHGQSQPIEAFKDFREKIDRR